MKHFTFFKQLLMGCLLACCLAALPVTAHADHNRDGGGRNGGTSQTQPINGGNNGNNNDSDNGKGDNPKPKPGPRDGGADD